MFFRKVSKIASNKVSGHSLYVGKQTPAVKVENWLVKTSNLKKPQTWEGPKGFFNRINKSRGRKNFFRLFNITVVSIEFFPLSSLGTNNGYQLHNGSY